MADLALSSIFSGMDTEALVQAELSALVRPVSRMEQQKSTYQEKVDALDAIGTSLSNVKYAAEQIADPSKLRAMTLGTSDSSVMTVSKTGTPSEGLHTVDIDRLATPESRVHAGVSPTETWQNLAGVAAADDLYIADAGISDATGADYKFVFQFGDEAQVSVDLSGYSDTGITLNQLVGEINTAAGYTAAEAALDGESYKLRLQAQNPGEGKALTITDEDSVSLLDAAEDFTQVVDGSDGGETLLGAGTFVYSYNGETRTVTTNESTTLDGLVDLINNDAGNPGVRASVLRHEVDADHEYHLVLAGRETGVDHAITVEAETTLADFGGAEWTVTQTAQDARFRVDGYPADPDWMTSSSNLVTDAIPGLSMTLKDVGSVTVTATRKTGDIKTNLQSLVDTYNSLVDKIDLHAGYDPETETSGVLLGDGSWTTMLQEIRRELTVTVPGFDADSDAYSMAAQIGLEIDRYGKLSLDSTALDDALSEDYYATLDLIGTLAKGVTDSEQVQFDSAHAETESGAYDVSIQFDAAGEVTGAMIKLAEEGDDAWRAMSVSGTTLTGGTEGPEQWMQLMAIADAAQAGTAYTENATVKVKRGFAGNLERKIEQMQNLADGTLALKRQSYTNAMDDLGRRIELKTERLEAHEERIRAKYARLEATLAQMDSYRGAFESMISSLSSSSGGSGQQSQ